MKMHLIALIICAFLCCLPPQTGFSREGGEAHAQREEFERLKLDDLIAGGRIAEAREYLFSMSKSGDRLAQKILLECYLGEKDLYGIDFGRLSGYWASQCELGDDSNYAGQLKIGKDMNAAAELLKLSLEKRNPYAGIIYAMMLKKGIYFEKNDLKAELLLNELRARSSAADFYCAFYCDQIEIEEEFFNPDLSALVKDKDSIYTFKPIESTAWASLCMVRDSSGKKYTYLSSVKNDMYKPKDNKKLVPIAAVADLAGGPEGRSIFKVNLDGKYDFKVNEKVYVSENSQSIVQKMGNSEFSSWRSFDYVHVEFFDCGIQILEICDNFGGSGSSRNFYFWGIVEEKGGDGPKFAIRHFGECFYFASAVDYFYDNFCIKGNVFARFVVGADLKKRGKARSAKPRLRIYSFERDAEKYERAKAEILNSIRARKVDY